MESPQLSSHNPHVDPSGAIRAAEATPRTSEPLPVRIMASFVSVVFHPLFIPSYVMAFLLYEHPYAFAGFDERMKMLRLLSVIVSTVLLPAFSIFLLWKLDFIRSIYLRTQKERIIPYAIALVFYFWIWYVFNNLSDSPQAAKEFLLGVFLGVCGAWMANIWFKVSMHGIGVGGLMAFFLLQSLLHPSVGGVYLSLSIAIAGLVCTARFIAGDHTRAEVYGGLFIGMLAQAVALAFA